MSYAMDSDFYPAQILRVHFSEGDQYQGRPLYEAMVEKCRELGIAGATVFRGLEGYGESGALHRAHLMARDQPIVMNIVDRAENIARLIPVLEEMLDTGLLAVSPVVIRRVEQSTAG
jgi:PII-like signaling protein